MGVLQKQVIPIALGKGLDTRTDKKQVAVGQTLELENCVIKNSQSFAKRNGYQSLTTTGIDGDLEAPLSELVYNDELVVHDATSNGGTLKAYSPSSDRWVNRGDFVPVVASSAQRAASTAPQQTPDSAASGAHVCYVWCESGSFIYMSIVDEASGVTIYPRTSVGSSNSTRPHVVAINGRFVITWVTTNGAGYDLYAASIDADNPTSFSITSSTVVAADIATTRLYDMLAYDNTRVMLVYARTAAGVRIIFLDSQGALLGGSYAPATLTAEQPATCISIFEAPTVGSFYVLYARSSGTDLRSLICGTTGTVTSVPATVDSSFSGGGSCVNVTGVAFSTVVRIFYEVEGYSPAVVLDPLYNYVKTAQITSSNVTGSIEFFMRQVGLACKAFTLTDEANQTRIQVGVVHYSSLQGTFYFLRFKSSPALGTALFALILSRHLYAAGPSTASPNYYIGNVWSTAAGVYSCAVANKRQITTEVSSGSLSSLTSVSKISVDFASRGTLRAAQLGQNLHVAGGYLHMYDGISAVEHGFHLYPEMSYLLNFSTTGGSMAPGVYRYAAVYEWVDNAGLRHRSAAAVPASITVPAGTSTNRVTVNVTSLSLTHKQWYRTGVTVSIYRTKAAGDIFYRITSLTSPVTNAPTSNVVSFTDGYADASIEVGEPLYTDSGEVDNWPAPACRDVTVYKNRLWVSGAEVEEEVWFSKEYVAGEPISFSEEFKKTVDPQTGGGVNCCFPIDDKLLAFRDGSYLYTYGDGPNVTNQGGAFQEFVEIAADVGCDNPQSLVKFGDGGVAFQTPGKGIFAIPSGTMRAVYLGAGVQEFNDSAVVGAVLVADQSQIRFVCDDGPVLVYDYLEQQWYTFTNLLSKAGVLWGSTLVLVRDDGRVAVETLDTYTDDGDPILRKIGTSWIALAGISGFQRVYQLRITGDYKSPHLLRVSVATDFSQTYDQVDDLDPEEMLADPGDESEAYRLRVDVQNQKCESIKFLIEETTTEETAGTQEAFTLASFSLYAGMKRGTSKVRTQQTSGG